MPKRKAASKAGQTSGSEEEEEEEEEKEVLPLKGSLKQTEVIRKSRRRSRAALGEPQFAHGGVYHHGRGLFRPGDLHKGDAASATHAGSRGEEDSKAGGGGGTPHGSGKPYGSRVGKERNLRSRRHRAPRETSTAAASSQHAPAFCAGGGESDDDDICDAQAVSVNSGCLGGFPIGVGCAVSGEGGLAFAVQSDATSPGHGELILTGKIGQSMRESCLVALSWVKCRAREITAWMAIKSMMVDLRRPDLDIHLNFPSCEAEKNGPSAGATIATSLVLLLTGAKLRPKIAISGEINMRGALLPIGNVKEKVAAASCQGITHIVLPSANIKQFRRLPAKTRGNIKAIKADHMCEVIRHAVESPTGFSAELEEALRSHAGMGITASLACSHVKGKVQWVECCATAGHGEWRFTGNIHEGTSGSVLVARTWVRKNAKEIACRLSARVLVDLCSMRRYSSHSSGKSMGGNGGSGAAGGGGGGSSANGNSDGPGAMVDIHVHLPETEVAKDVSINGAAAAVSMISVMTGLCVRQDVAILGEITLAGVLWPLEQVNEAEVSTARQANITHLILPEDNVRQIERVPHEIRDGLKITGIVRLMDILPLLFLPPSSDFSAQDSSSSSTSASDGDPEEKLSSWDSETVVPLR